MCRDAIRNYLDGVYVHHVATDRALRFVATDGHRLATADIPSSDQAADIRPVIPSRGFVAEAIKVTSNRRDGFQSVRLSIHLDHAQLTYWDGSTMDWPLVDGTFPDYERVIPRGEPPFGKATIAQEPLARAVVGLTEFAKASGKKWRDSPAGMSGSNCLIPTCRTNLSATIWTAARCT